MATFKELQEEIRLHEARIEELATNLRCELEELSELARKLWESDEDYIAPDGTRMNDYEVQDLADEVSVIEQTFDKD